MAVAPPSALSNAGDARVGTGREIDICVYLYAIDATSLKSILNTRVDIPVVGTGFCPTLTIVNRRAGVVSRPALSNRPNV